MSKIENRLLSADELDAVSGCFGCSLPPLREGPTWADLYNDWVQRGKDLAAGQTSF